MRDHESEIILFEAAARELKRLSAVPLPTTESMKAELAVLNVKKEKLLAEYETVKQNVDTLLSVPKEKTKDISNILQNFVSSTCHLL